MPDTDEALTRVEAAEDADRLLCDFLYAVRGLRSVLYVSRPTAIEGNKTAMLNRCKVCGHTSVGKVNIPHHPNCALDRLARAWKPLKDAKMPKKQAETVDPAV